MPRTRSSPLRNRIPARVWRTAPIAPQRPRDLAASWLSLPRSSWTPAECLVHLLEEGHGIGLGEDGPDMSKLAAAAEAEEEQLERPGVLEGETGKCRPFT